MPTDTTQSSQSILIIDRSTDSRQVLCTALEQRGRQILEAGGPDLGLELAEKHQPTLVIWDFESGNGQTARLEDCLKCQLQDRQTTIVLLGKASRSLEDLPRSEFVAKPYHYGPLIHKIESLLKSV